MRRRVRLLTSAACGVLAVMLAVAYADSARAEVLAERALALERYGGEVTTLVVAKTSLSAGDLISESNVEEREWLTDLAPAGAITQLNSVVGTRLNSSVGKGEPLNEVDVEGTDGAIEVPEGRVAISVRLSDKTGIRQDVAYGSQVLAYRFVGDSLELITSDALVISNAAAATTSSSKETICLAVLPSDVEAVFAASSDASLRLALPGSGVETSGFETLKAPDSVDAIEEQEGEATAETRSGESNLDSKDSATVEAEDEEPYE